MTFPCFVSGVTSAWQGINNKWNCGNRKKQDQNVGIIGIIDELYRVLSE